MTNLPPAPATLDRIAAAVATLGYAVEPDFLPATLTARLGARAHALDAAGALRPAGIGRRGARTIATGVRGDRIQWLDAHTPDPSERAVLDALDALRLALNQRLLLGLFELEVHYAIYPPGAGYSAHRDRFRDDDARVLSCVVYLNEDWDAEHGGALRLRLAGGATHDVLPRSGTLVAFLSERLVHEVLPATRERVSLAGWFRRRA
jgi:SM-20-related protein